MGIISWTLGQLAVSSVALGALKRGGVITFKPEAVSNDTLRALLTQAVSGPSSQMRRGAPAPRGWDHMPILLGMLRGESIACSQTRTGWCNVPLIAALRGRECGGGDGAAVQAGLGRGA